MDPDNPQATAPVVPQQDQINDPGYTNKDLRDESIRDIAANTEEPKAPETPKTAEVIPEVTKDEEKPQEDLRQIAEETAKRVLEEQEAKRVADEETRKTEEAKLTPQEDAYAKYEKELWEKENRTPSYTEALNFIKEQAKNEFRSEQEAARAVWEADQAKQREAQEAENKAINAYVDEELNDLYSQGKMTPIKDNNNPSDQGVVERKALFAKWMEVNQQRKAEGKSEILSASRIFYNYYQKPDAQPAGADAPISGGRGTANNPTDEQQYTYQDLKKPWSFFGRKG